jgi:hypothetical protein
VPAPFRECSFQHEIRSNLIIQVKAFNKEFVNVDNGELFELILAANYLNIKNLLDITCQAVAEQIRGKTPQQIREIFLIEVRRSARCLMCFYACVPGTTPPLCTCALAGQHLQDSPMVAT